MIDYLWVIHNIVWNKMWIYWFWYGWFMVDVFVHAGWPDRASCAAKTWLLLLCSRSPPFAAVSTWNRGNKGRPSGRLHSDAQVSRQKTLCTSVSEHRNCGAMKACNYILTNFSLVLKSLVRTMCKLTKIQVCVRMWERTSISFQESLYTLGFSATATCHLWLKRNSTRKALRRCNPT